MARIRRRRAHQRRQDQITTTTPLQMYYKNRGNRSASTTITLTNTSQRQNHAYRRYCFFCVLSVRQPLTQWDTAILEFDIEDRQVDARSHAFVLFCQRTAGSTADRPPAGGIPHSNPLSASIAWIDYSTKDDAQDIEQIAQRAGFTKLPIARLSTGFYSAYEDYDTELGIMLPSVTMKSDNMTVHPLFVLIRENFILTVHSEDINRLLRFSRYAQPFFKRISAKCTCDKITLMLNGLLMKTMT